MASCLVVTAGCGDDSGSGDSCDGGSCGDAGEMPCVGPSCSPAEDGSVDEAPGHDAATDAQVDEAPDAMSAPDAAGDSAVDETDDAAMDATVDETGDAQTDAATDASTDEPDAAPDATASPTCDDDTQNGDETDEDCGGEACEPCAHGQSCDIDDDCTTGHCATTCVDPPTAGFTLSASSIDVPATVTASSTAVANDGTIALVEYDWGTGYEAAASHMFTTGGSHVVRQRVTDSQGLTATAMLNISAFKPVRMSTTDKSSHVVISGDGLIVTQLNVLGSDGGARSDTSIAPGSGVYYFEATRLGAFGYYGFGVGTATTNLAHYLGDTDESIGVDTFGHMYFADIFENGASGPTVGFVVDYRGVRPIVHVVSSEGDTTVERRFETLDVTVPVFAMYTGQTENQGPAGSFNFGSDTTNHPFVLDPIEALDDGGHTDTATALVLGFGQTRARPFSAAPVLTTSGDMSVASGTEVTLTAGATDAEDGPLTASIEWENLATSIHDRESGTGGSFTFTPPEIGKYPIKVTVRDSFRVETTHTIMIEATGTLPQLDPVRLVADDRSGDGIELSPDGLSARFTVNQKGGIHANQGLYGRFWYFEMHRLIDPPGNIGGGLVIERGSLNPMHFETMHPSVQINFLGSLWRDLVHEWALDPTARYYGYAVDYRGDNPIVYIIVEDEVAYAFELDNVWVPLYPMLYGNPTAGGSPYDSEINFGATPFHNDPVLALTNGGYSTDGLEVGWGDANLP